MSNDVIKMTAMIIPNTNCSVFHLKKEAKTTKISMKKNMLSSTMLNAFLSITRTN